MNKFQPAGHLLTNPLSIHNLVFKLCCWLTEFPGIVLVRWQGGRRLMSSDPASFQTVAWLVIERTLGHMAGLEFALCPFVLQIFARVCS